ncbi:MAG TPA: DUF512 domain-containing protein [Gemmatimonadetes bacterium]|nr:DUF512 domain-containing protein [Gemmatimonadota bacterium]
MIRIAEIESGSIADELHLEIGTRILRINGQRVRDGIDLTFLLADNLLELETIALDGSCTVHEIEHEPGETLGVVPAPDKIRECGNKCVFCFIDGNPKNVRDTLWIRDDDFRLSFTYGTYVTLTNLGDKGLQRLVDQKISPLYVSVHATDPDLRTRLLVNNRAGLIMEQLEFLLDNGLNVHTQVVLCPEWNDREHLDHTMRDLYSLGGGIISLSVVPVGLTKYNTGVVRPLSITEAELAVEQIEIQRKIALEDRGYGWVYAADELFMRGGKDFPADNYYDDGALTENGVGAVNQFVRDFETGIEELPELPNRKIRVITGTSMQGLFFERKQMLQERTGADIEIVGVVNKFFGDTVTVAGLLAGQDIKEQVGETREDEIILLPADALNADDLLIDSVTLNDMNEYLAPATVRTGYELTECLKDLDQ